MSQEPATRIHENAIKAWTLNSLLFGLAWFIPTVIYISIMAGQSIESNQLWHSNINWIVLSTVFIVSLFFYLLTAKVLPNVRWKRWKYSVSEKEVDLQRGIFIKKRTLVPINRVQHVDTRQGPIYRKFGLASVTISTAATTHEIPALDTHTADDLRNKISNLVRKVKGDV